ncbi:MAG: alpha/beta hydrolase, partial [Pseudomonadota bacterium]
VQQFYGGAEEPGRAAYEEQRQAWAEEPPEFDPSSGLRIYVPAFSEMLSTIDVPVLALFGEKDTSVDWRGTKALYESTIGQADGGRLTVKTFPNGNHNLHVSETGGFDEMLDILNEGPVMVPGYSQTIGVFLKTVSVQD